MVAYLLITLAIVVPLARSHQLRTNPRGAATGAIFFTCSIHHGRARPAHAAAVPLGVGRRPRTRDDVRRGAWPLAIWESIGALTRCTTGR